MNLVSILVALLRAGLPLPDWRSREQFLVWWGGLGPVAFDILDALTPDEKGLVSAPSPDAIVAAVQAEVPEANGEMIKKLLALLMQVLPYILPLLLKPAPAPQPAPLTT